MKRFSLALSLIGVTALAQASLAQPPAKDDVIARVGDQPITFSEINTMLNSSAVVGVSLPALGTPERDQVRIALLDKVVSANLVYLDALEKGVDKDPEYRRDMQRFENGMLAGLYGQQHLVGDLSVSDGEIQAYFETSIAPGTELTDELRTQIEAVLRKRKGDQLKTRSALTISQLREQLGVEIYERNIGADGDATRPDDTPVARVGDETVRWGEVKAALIAAGKGAVKRDIMAWHEEGRLAALNAEVDTRVLAQMARKQGLEQDPVYQRRLGEYRKTRLINIHRAALARRFEPDEAALAAYYAANRDSIRVPEARKLQMVVVESEQQARDIKAAIDKGDTTLYKAARDHSIDPGAKRNLGEIGWVLPGEGQPALDEALFALGPGEISEPVETPAGWHLLLATDVREEQYGNLAEPATRQRTRRAYIHDKLDAYVVDLRKNHFPVEVDEANLTRLAQAEADMVKALSDKAAQPGSVTETRLQELQKIIKQP